MGYTSLIILAASLLIHIAIAIAAYLFDQNARSQAKIQLTPPDGMTAPEVGYWSSLSFEKGKPLGPEKPKYQTNGRANPWASVLSYAAHKGYIDLTITEVKGRKHSNYIYELARAKGQEIADIPVKFFAEMASLGNLNSTTAAGESQLNKLEKSYNEFMLSSLSSKYFSSKSTVLSFNLYLPFVAVVLAIRALFLTNWVMLLICIAAFALSLAIYAFARKVYDTPYNALGIQRIKQIEGFKLYLGANINERKRIKDAPSLSYELFEEYLPYAVALGVEEDWLDGLQAQNGDSMPINPKIHFKDMGALTARNYPIAAVSGFRYGTSQAESPDVEMLRMQKQIAERAEMNNLRERAKGKKVKRIAPGSLADSVSMDDDGSDVFDDLIDTAYVVGDVADAISDYTSSDDSSYDSGNDDSSSDD